ncbi:hypothetical protein [Streptomyces sp. NPDC048606]|uniref:hypothetical protein n=1 Tax=Streptomyces sp. NPDC048606 TaxID=3154726 RepID=UPI0034327074
MRQRISLLAACGLVAVGLAATPANAADPVFTLTGSPAALALTPHPGGTGTPKPASLALRLDRPSGDTKFTFTVDLSGIDKVADVKEKNPAATGPRCEKSGTTLVCADRTATGGGPAGIDLEVTAAKDAANGATGTLTVTGTATGASVTAARTAIQVGGPDLVMTEMALKTAPKPGESQPLPLAFANRGTQSAHGVILELEATHGLELPERYDNCTYTPGRTSTAVRCVVDGEFKADESYEVAGESPLHLKASAHARTERFAYGVLPVAPAARGGAADQGTADRRTGQDAQDAPGGQAAKKGTGGRKLIAKKRVTAKPGPDLNPSDNRREAFIGVENKADFAADALALKGASGATVKAPVTIRNLGPGWVFDPKSPEAPAAVAEVRFPKDVKVVKVPASCRAAAPSETSRYLCATASSVLEKEKIEFPFEVRPEKDLRDAKGAITVGLPDAKGELGKHAFDPNLANNQADVVVNPTAVSPSPSPSTSTGASPSPSASTSASASPTAGAGGNSTPQGGTTGSGPLASTGSGAALIGLAAAALFAVGGALFLVFRRRGAAHA